MTDYKSMFEQAVRTLAAIDEALGIGDDGCGDPDQTLTAIDDLKAAAQRGEALALTVMGDQTSHDHKQCRDCGQFLPRDRWVRTDDPYKAHGLCRDCGIMYDDPAFM